MYKLRQSRIKKERVHEAYRISSSVLTSHMGNEALRIAAHIQVSAAEQRLRSKQSPSRSRSRESLCVLDGLQRGSPEPMEWDPNPTTVSSRTSSRQGSRRPSDETVGPQR